MRNKRDNGDKKEREKETRGTGLLQLAQHMWDEGGPFLGEADLVHGPLGASIVATSALVSVVNL